MPKKLGSILVIALIGLIIYGAVNAESLCKKYIYPVKYEAAVEKYARENKLDKYFIFAIIKTESNFKSDAVSEVGARGLMQLMEDAFDWVKFRMDDERDIDYDDMFNPEYNIQYGSYLIGLLYSEYGDAETALAAYFMGRGQVNEWLKNSAYSKDGKTLSEIPSSAAAHYVNKVMNAYKAYYNLYK